MWSLSLYFLDSQVSEITSKWSQKPCFGFCVWRIWLWFRCSCANTTFSAELSLWIQFCRIFIQWISFTCSPRSTAIANITLVYKYLHNSDIDIALAGSAISVWIPVCIKTPYPPPPQLQHPPSNRQIHPPPPMIQTISSFLIKSDHLFKLDISSEFAFLPSGKA